MAEYSKRLHIYKDIVVGVAVWSVRLCYPFTVLYIVQLAILLQNMVGNKGIFAS